MMITGQANIVFLFFVRALGIGWLQKLRTPFTPFHFETICCCCFCCYFVQLQFILHSQQVYSKFVSFHMLFYAFIRYSAKNRLLKNRANNMRLIEWTDLLGSFVSKYNLHLFSRNVKTICSMLLMQFVSVTMLPLFIYKRGKKRTAQGTSIINAKTSHNSFRILFTFMPNTKERKICDAPRRANICTSIVKIVICFSWSIYWQNVEVVIGFPSVLNQSFVRLSKRTPISTNTKILIIFVMLNGYDSFYMNNFVFLLHKINTQYHFLVIFWPEAMTL